MRKLILAVAALIALAVSAHAGELKDGTVISFRTTGQMACKTHDVDIRTRNVFDPDCTILPAGVELKIVDHVEGTREFCLQASPDRSCWWTLLR